MSLGTWWTDLLKKPEPEEKDHLIAVVGVLGAGKSTFINRAVGGNDLKTSGPGGSCQYLYLFV
jgi:putative ribosome biogenesis GTPase RsgA